MASSSSSSSSTTTNSNDDSNHNFHPSEESVDTDATVVIVDDDKQQLSQDNADDRIELIRTQETEGTDGVDTPDVHNNNNNNNTQVDDPGTDVTTNVTAAKESAMDTTTTTTGDTDETTLSDNQEDDDDEDTVKSVKFDYASKSAGALILEKSAGWKGASSLLTSDNDRYAIIPCAETSKSVVISLSEDILVKHVVLANYERFSSTVKEFQLLGSQTMGKWVDLGTYTAKQGGGKQEFELYEYSWARYLKIRVLSYYGNEHYLTISQISVFGDTMLQGFHEHWEEEQEHDDDAAVKTKGTTTAHESVDATVESEAFGTNPETPSSPSEQPADTEGEENDHGSVNPVEISEFTHNDPCIDNLEKMCPKDLSFEQLVFHISSNQSYFDRMSFLGSSSSCRSLSKYEHGDFPEIRVQSMSPIAAMAKNEARQSTNDARILAATTTTDDDEAPVTLDTTDSPVISQIQSLIKTAAGIDVDLSKINALFQGHDDNVEGKEGEKSLVADPTGPKTPVVADHTAGESQGKPATNPPAESKDNGRPGIMGEEEWSKVLQALEHVPSSSCLKEIDFTDFRKRLSSNKNGQTGGGNGHASGGSVELQPIFKRLTDEIKTLQGTLGVQEDFLKKSMACYQKVILELLVQQEERHSRVDKRLEDLEHAINTYLMWLHFVEACIAAVVGFVGSALTKPWNSWLSMQGQDTTDTITISVIAITVLIASRLIVFSTWRWLRRRFSKSKDNEMKQTKAEIGSEKSAPSRHDNSTNIPDVVKTPPNSRKRRSSHKAK